MVELIQIIALYLITKKRRHYNVNNVDKEEFSNCEFLTRFN